MAPTTKLRESTVRTITWAGCLSGSLLAWGAILKLVTEAADKVLAI